MPRQSDFYGNRAKLLATTIRRGTMAFIETAKLFVMQLFCAMDRDDGQFVVMTSQEYLQTEPATAH